MIPWIFVNYSWNYPSTRARIVSVNPSCSRKIGLNFPTHQSTLTVVCSIYCVFFSPFSRFVRTKTIVQISSITIVEYPACSCTCVYIYKQHKMNSLSLPVSFDYLFQNHETDFDTVFALIERAINEQKNSGGKNSRKNTNFQGLTRTPCDPITRCTHTHTYTLINMDIHMYRTC